MDTTPRRSDHGARTAKAARTSAVKLVPDSGAVEDLVAAVGDARRRAIQLLDADLGPFGPTGMWIATERGDYIVHPADASAAERTAVICHELAHMLLGHQPEGADEALQQMAATVAPDISTEVAQRFLGRHSYADRLEADAEHLGTVLVTQLARNAAANTLRRDAVSERLR